MTPERKARVWLASVACGLASSIVLAGVARAGLYWFPPIWPGLVLAYASKAWAGQSVGSQLLILAGNTAFYTWMFSRILQAEISARGHLSRYFLR
jgi:hypothetical protein